MKFIRVLIGLFLTFSVIFTVFYGKNNISNDGEEKQPMQYKGIISVWQVDSFEGGTGSRKQFLLKVARAFEKKYTGVLVMVTDYTANGVKENQANGISPDIISFGCGTDVKDFSKLSLNTDFNGGKIGSETYAVPWCRGGYALISNPKLTDGKDEEIDKLLVSQTEFTQPLIAVLEEKIPVKEIEVKKPMDAYVKFVSGKTKYFLGTQRDLMRLKNRGMEVNVRPLENYSDLVQYAVITTSDQVKRFYAEEFLRFLISEQVQENLYDIGMYSVVTNIKTDDEQARLMQKVSSFKTLSPFTSPEILKEMQSLGVKAISGDESAVNKIKNILVLP